MEEERRAADQEEAARNHRRMAARAKREQAEMERRQQDLKARAIEARLAPASQNSNTYLLGKLRAVQDQQKLHTRHKDIVSAAIEAVINQASSGQKQSHAEFNEGSKPAAVAPQIHKKPGTVFSRMMRAPQKVTDSPRDFSHWDAHLQQALDDQVSSGYGRSESDWAADVTDKIKTSLESMILPYTRHRAHPQTKINALHVLIEIATAVYAPRSTAADMIRKGSLPRILLDYMLEIAERMSGSERNTVLEEQAFLSKVKTLSYQPMILWEGSTWTALDEVLRLMKDPSPVGFRMILDQLTSQIHSGHGVASIATGVRRIIKSDITSYITPCTCFESKYNAMNVLVDAGILAMKEFGTSYRNSTDVLVEMAVALSELGKILDRDEVRRIHSEMVQEECFSSANFLDDFLESIDDDTLAFKARGNRQSTRDYHFKANVCAKLRDLVERKEWQNKRAHGNDGLLAKVLLLRWNNNAYDPSWFKCRDALDDLLEVLVDGSVPLTCDRYQWKVDSVLHNAVIQGSDMYTREKAIKEVRAGVDRNIGHVLALARKGCMETKINAFRTLAQIGMKMIEWMAPGRLRWQVEFFKDHLSEDAVMVICDSMIKMGGNTSSVKSGTSHHKRFGRLKSSYTRSIRRIGWHS